MRGELSASHMFVSCSGTERAALGLGTHEGALGIYLDHGYEGAGRRMADVLAGAPLDRQNLGINAGDIITSINGQPVSESGGLDKLLDLNAGRQVVVGAGTWRGCRAAGAGAPNQPAGRTGPVQCAFDRCPGRDGTAQLHCLSIRACHGQWSLSGPACDADRFVRCRQGRVGRLRSNSGGNLTRELTTLLTCKAYATMGRDDGAKLIEPNNRWVPVLVDSFGYSDGSVFPQAYHDNAIGKLVGDKVLNTGTAVTPVMAFDLPDGFVRLRAIAPKSSRTFATPELSTS